MKRKLFRAIPVAALAAAAVAGAVLLWTQPWSGGAPVKEAAAGIIQHRLCDTVVDAPLAQEPPARDLVVVGRRMERTATGNLTPVMEVKLIVPSSGDPSSVFIDPASGAPLQEIYSSSAHETLLTAVLNTVRIEPLDPATAPWPYTDRTQMPLELQRHGAFEYRPPDPGSGIVVSVTQGTGERVHVHVLRVANCRSTMEKTAVFRIGAEPDDVTMTKDIHPDDEAAFQTFFDQVVIRGLAP